MMKMKRIMSPTKEDNERQEDPFPSEDACALHRWLSDLGEARMKLLDQAFQAEQRARQLEEWRNSEIAQAEAGIEAQLSGSRSSLVARQESLKRAQEEIEGVMRTAREALRSCGNTSANSVRDKVDERAPTAMRKAESVLGQGMPTIAPIGMAFGQREGVNDRVNPESKGQQRSRQLQPCKYSKAQQALAMAGEDVDVEHLRNLYKREVIAWKRRVSAKKSNPSKSAQTVEPDLSRKAVQVDGVETGWQEWYERAEQERYKAVQERDSLREENRELRGRLESSLVQEVSRVRELLEEAHREREINSQEMKGLAENLRSVVGNKPSESHGKQDERNAPDKEPGESKEARTESERLLAKIADEKVEPDNGGDEARAPPQANPEAATNTGGKEEDAQANNSEAGYQKQSGGLSSLLQELEALREKTDGGESPPSQADDGGEGGKEEEEEEEECGARIDAYGFLRLPKGIAAPHRPYRPCM